MYSYITTFQICNDGPHETLGMTVGGIMMAVLIWVACLAMDKVGNLVIQCMYILLWV